MSGGAKVSVLGVELDALEFDQAVAMILEWVRQPDSGPRYVVTPNVNHLVLHSENAAFRRAYAEASLVLADGRYIGLLARLTGGGRIPATINGSDLVPALLAGAEEQGGLRVFLLGALEGVAERAAENIERRWPRSKVVGVYSPPYGFENDPEECASIRARVNGLAPDLLIVGISPPRQETWLSGAIADLDIGVAVCAGGTIDFLAGSKSRAPAWMQRSGLEWVHRISQEPGRLLPRYTRDGLAICRLVFPEILRRVAGRPAGTASRD